MSSTLSLYFGVKGVIGSDLVDFPTGHAYAPVSITLSNDIRLVKKVSIANATETELIAIGSGNEMAAASFLVIIPSVLTTVNWQLSSDANNSNASVAANTPLILSTAKAVAYNATSATGISGSPAAIARVSAYQSSGSAGTVEIWAGY